MSYINGGWILRMIKHLMDITTAYRCWQAPFVKSKFLPIIKSGDIERARSVLDLGCGPGTNAPYFSNHHYVGVDFNPGYVAYAQKRFHGQFVVGDVCNLSLSSEEKFDFVLLNSLLHHIDDNGVLRALKNILSLLASDGQVHILDLVLPAERSLAYLLAKKDRGKFARPVEHWEKLFSTYFNILVFEEYPVKFCGVVLWNMIYFKGRQSLLSTKKV